MADLFNPVVLAKNVGHPRLIFPLRPVFWLMSGPVSVPAVNVLNADTSHHFLHKQSPIISHLLDCPTPFSFNSSLLPGLPPGQWSSAPTPSPPPAAPGAGAAASSLVPLPRLLPVSTFSIQQAAQPCDKADQTMSLPFLHVSSSFPRCSWGLGSRPRSGPCLLLLPYPPSQSNCTGISLFPGQAKPFPGSKHPR